MAAAVKIGFGMKKLLYIILLSFLCHACAQYDTRADDEQLKKQPMIFALETGEHRINRRRGFVIYMKPAEADRVGAPDSPEFMKLLEDQLAIEEQKNGYLFCVNGYEIVDDYTYYFRIISAECK